MKEASQRALRRTSWTATLVLFALAAGAGGASAHAPREATTASSSKSSDAEAPVPPRVRRAVGAGTRAMANGLYRVRPAIGPPLLTHGPDARSLAEAEERPLAAGEIGFQSGDLERPPLCASDYYQHVLYARPSGTANRYDAVKGDIQASIRRMNAVINADSLASGGVSADYKVRCDGAGEIAVGSFVSQGSSFSQIVTAARAAGFDAANADYTIFFDGTASTGCGIGSYIDDERLSADNANNEGGGYGITYSGCWTGLTAMHENGHNMGAVQAGSPNSTGSGGHCNDENDVMCYSPDGGDRNQAGTVFRCSGYSRFDCNFDDYFDALPEPGEYLAENWNLGSSLNRFIAFSLDPSEEQPVIPEAVIEPIVSGSEPSEPTTGVPGEWRRFRFKVPRDAKALVVKLSADPTADLALYVRAHTAPSKKRFDCRVRTAEGRAVCRIRRPLRGKWYAGVLNRGGGAETQFQLTRKVRR